MWENYVQEYLSKQYAVIKYTKMISTLEVVTLNENCIIYIICMCVSVCARMTLNNRKQSISCSERFYNNNTYIYNFNFGSLLNMKMSILIMICLIWETERNIICFLNSNACIYTYMYCMLQKNQKKIYVL